MSRRTYVFLQGTVAGVGGAQMYGITKAKWLKEQGWEPVVVYALDGGIVLDYDGIELKHCEMLLLRPGALSKRSMENTVNEVASWFADCGQIVFETNVIDFAYWAELFAERLGGTNFVFSLGEKPSITSKEERDFYWAKYEKGEFASITESFLDALFLKHDERYKDVILFAHEGGAVADLPIADELMPYGYDCVIGVVSRLEKSFVRDAVRGIAVFAKRHPEKKIACVCIGGDGDEAAVAFVRSSLVGLGNIELSILGEFSPLPRKLLGSLDVAVAKAGCIDCCLESGTLTVKYKMDEDVPLGVVCHDIPRNSAEAFDKSLSLEDYLERALVDRCYAEGTERYPYERLVADFSLHQHFLNRILETQRRGGYLTAHCPRAPFVKRALACIAVATGKYPHKPRKSIRKMLKLANG